MKTTERNEELKKIMNQGFYTQNNYVSNKIGTISWIVNKNFNETSLLMAKAAQNICSKLVKWDPESGYLVKELKSTEITVYKIIEEGAYSTMIEIELVEWMDQNETMIRINYWEANLSENDKSVIESNEIYASLMYEFIAQELEQ